MVQMVKILQSHSTHHEKYKLISNQMPPVLRMTGACVGTAGPPSVPKLSVRFFSCSQSSTSNYWCQESSFTITLLRLSFLSEFWPSDLISQLQFCHTELGTPKHKENKENKIWNQIMVMGLLKSKVFNQNPILKG